MLTTEQAQMLCDAHEVDALLENEEEIELLEANNPELLEAYRALSRMAIGSGAQRRLERLAGERRNGD